MGLLLDILSAIFLVSGSLFAIIGGIDGSSATCNLAKFVRTGIVML